MSRFIVLGAVILAAASFQPTASAASPTILSVTPAPGSTVSALSQITVTFSASVVGAQASDLQINELPAVSRTASNAVVTFQFSQPPSGVVAVNFDSDAVITDQTGNLFDTLAVGAAWIYTLSDIIAPAVAVMEPAVGAVVGTLNQVEVLFTEPVTGVDAADFLVNGVSASTVTTVASDRYRFSFAPAASGSATISWAPGHGIRDVSPAVNPFAGIGWSYTVNPSVSTSVVINEILAENRTSLEDEDGQKQDWIELRNYGASPVNLTGWSLTDDAAVAGKWVFPNVNLAAGQFLIVFASGKDRKTTAANATNHTNFRLNLSGGYLGLSLQC